MNAVVAILLNSLWEDALIALVVFAIVRGAPGLNASTRYAIWWVALVAALLVPVASSIPFAGFWHPSTSVSNAAPGIATLPASHAPWRSRTVDASSKAGEPMTAPSPQRWKFSVPDLLAKLAFAAWALVALAFVVRLVLALVQLERLKSDALPLPVEYRDTMNRWLDAIKGSRDVRLCVSDATDVPIAVGLFDAMILIPRRLLEILASDEVDQISLHELAHLRRSDDWTNGVQRVIQAVLFFNPAVQLIGQQLDLEREVACDDWVLAQTGAVRSYALCLTKMAETASWPHRPMPAPGVFITRKNISIRIERLLRAGRNIRTPISFRAASLAALAVTAVALVVTSVAPSIAFTAVVATASTPAPRARPAQKPARRESARPPLRVRTAAPAVPAATASPLELGGPHAARVVAMAIASAAPISKSIAGPAALVAEANNARGGQPGCVGCSYEGANWAGRDMHGQNFEGADFSSGNFEGANFTRSNLTGCDMKNANLRHADFANANLEGCDFDGADLRDANLTGSQLEGADFGRARFGPEQARQILAHCEGCDFRGRNFQGADLSNLDLSGIDFRNADLRGVSFAGSRLEGLDFRGSNLNGANFNGAHLVGCEMKGANLQGVDLSRAEMEGIEFRDHNRR